MRGVLIEDYNNPLYKSLAHGVVSHFMLQDKRLPFYAVMDATILHFKHWTTIVFNPRVASAWKTLLESYYTSDIYRRLNETTAGEPLFAKYATISFLNSLLNTAYEVVKHVKLQTTNPIEEVINYVQQNPSTLRKIVDKVMFDMIEVLNHIETAKGFSHFGVPVAELMKDIDKFREAMSNRIVVSLLFVLRKMRREAQQLRHAKIVTPIGGRPLGVKTLQRWNELSYILPFEHLDDDLLTYRIASRTVKVYERKGGVPDYVVYIDKSGSMAGGIGYRTSPTHVVDVPKISFAAATALALAQQLRRHGARLTLKTFDVEVHDPITNFRQLIDVLLRIRADSGTNISNVLYDALNHKNEKIIVITDGIDDVSEDAVRATKAANIDLTFVFIKTDNELLRRNFRCVRIEEAKPSILLEI